MMCLPKPPSQILDVQGEPIWGTYAGPLPPIQLGAFARQQGVLAEYVRRKRWIYSAIATDRLFLGMAMTDLGYASNAFLFVAEVGPGGRMLADFSWMGVPRLGCHVGDFPEEGCDAWFRTPTVHLAFVRPKGSSAYSLTAITPTLRIYATLDTVDAPTPLSAILRPDQSPLMMTEKRVLMPTRGAMVLHGTSFSLDGAVGGIDYSQGYPPRETAWRWGFFMGKCVQGHSIAMNLVQGFNGQPECSLWYEGRSYSLEEGSFSFKTENPQEPWSIQTENGAVLSFEPSAIHRETHDFGFVASRFLQPVGVFRGHFEVPDKGRIRIDGVPGVVEDQYVLW